MRILFLSRWRPYPVSNGSKIRILNILRNLCRIHQVTLISFYDLGEDDSDGDLRQLGLQDVHLIPYQAFNPLDRRALTGLLSPKPRSIVATHSAEVEQTITEITKTNQYDVVIASQFPMAAYHHCFSDIPAIFEEAELGLFHQGHAVTPSILRRFRARLTLEKHRRFVGRLVRKFKFCTVASEIERNLLTRAAPGYGRIRVVPNGIDLENCERLDRVRRRNSLIFAGSFRYFPNHDAMKWFLGNIYPIVKSGVRDAQLVITGDGASRVLPPAEDVVMTGFVPDARPFVASAAVSVAPLRVGGGTRLKVLESMALRTPVVATAKAVEGLNVENGRHLLIADDAREFAEAVVGLLKQPEIGFRLAENALRLVREKYDWRKIGPFFLNLVEDAARA